MACQENNTPTKRIVDLPGNRKVSLGHYVQCWRKVLSCAPGTEFKSGFNRWPESRETILREFRRGMADRINRHIPGFGKGRKWAYEWQIETERAARQLNHPRLVIHWLPIWLKPRFAHRLDSEF